jgi:putative serine protease PepD
MVDDRTGTDAGAEAPRPGVFPGPVPLSADPGFAPIAEVPTLESPGTVRRDRREDKVATGIPAGAFPAPGADDRLAPGPFSDPRSSTPAPPAGLPLLLDVDAPAPHRSAPVHGSMPNESPFARTADATPAPPEPFPRDPWLAPSTGGMPSSPPQYDPHQFGGAFGAAGGSPPGLVPVLPAPAASGAPPATPSPTSARTALLVGVLSAIVASLITGGLFVAFAGRRTETVERPPDPSTTTPALVANTLDIHGLLDKAQPSVVTIRTDTTSVGGKLPLAAGSGVIISADGLVLTNAHVIAGASGLKVILFDGTSKAATLVGSFPDDDVALIKITEPGTLTPAVLGTATDLKVGDPVIAIGNALNLGGSPSVTEGIVSAKDRDIQTSEGNLTNLIQTDAAINPGNSGGPLLNASGQVVGINTAIIENSQNIGFAISIDVIKPRIEDLKNGKGTVTPNSAFMGVSTQSVADVAAAVLQKYGVTATEGAFVSEVLVGSSAEDAGLQPGDVITAIDGKAVASAADVGSAIRTKKAGDTIEVEYEREGETATVTVTLKSRSTTGK